MFIASRPEELADRETLLSMSGLEFMRAILAGRVSAPPISARLGFRLEAVSEGEVSFTGTPTVEVCNPMGTVHGGWYGTLLDSAMACAVMTVVPKGALYTTLEYKVNITRPIPLGTPVRATGRVQHAGRRTGVAAGEITGVEDGRLYATGSTTCLIMPG